MTRPAPRTRHPHGAPPSAPVAVAHVITRLDVGGAQATAVRTCALLDPTRYRPVLVAGVDTGSGGSLAPAARRAGVEVVELPELVSPIRPHRDVAAVRALRGFLEERGIALVHTHSSKAGAIGRWAARPLPVATVHTVHGWSFHDGQHPAAAGAYRAVERRLARRTDALLVVTPVDERLGLAAGVGTADRYRLVRSGIALPDPPSASQRAAARAALGWDDATLGLVSVGRLAAQKDPLTLLEAVARVAVHRPEVALAVVGDGELRPEVAARAAEPDLAGRVQLLGIRADVAEVVGGADLYVSAARWEGLPRTLLEAVAVGVPTLVTDVGGVRDVVAPGVTGELVAPGDPAALAAAIEASLADPSGRAARAGAARAVVGAFGEEEMARRTMAVYDEVLGIQNRRAAADGSPPIPDEDPAPR